ncbi:MAG: formimidoylglutamate deiminase [Myxococcales bacterium]|nr:formimidoylglutamate deiminase [Myxococcales bacterium]
MTLRLTDGFLELPALATAHSHAFQRGMRGLAQRPGEGGARDDDFWSWREAMYRLADSLTPESLHAIARVAYRELRHAGVLTVGEFHYVHHQRDGTPYADRTAMSDAVIEAALAEGMRVALLRVVYARAGAGRPPEGAQRRFADPSLAVALADVERLRARWREHPRVRIGIAPHSVRAVPPEWLTEIAEFAAKDALWCHMHVAEQPAEVALCLAETGMRPVELLAERGMLGPRFVAVHATHLGPGEASLLGAGGARVCLCPTTERDLGDGLPDVGALLSAGVRLCVGIDSHVLCSPLEELRGIELGERLRTGKRLVLRSNESSLAEALWRAGSHNGAEACGFDDAGGTLRIARAAPQLQLVADERLLDAVVFSGTDALLSGSATPPHDHVGDAETARAKHAG